MLDHLHSPGGGNEGGTRSDIDSIRAIATSAGRIHESVSSDGEWIAHFQESFGRAGNVCEGLAAGADMGKQRRDMNIVVVAHGQGGKYLHGFFDGGLRVIQEGLQGAQGMVIHC